MNLCAICGQSAPFGKCDGCGAEACRACLTLVMVLTTGTSAGVPPVAIGRPVTLDQCDSRLLCMRCLTMGVPLKFLEPDFGPLTKKSGT